MKGHLSTGGNETCTRTSSADEMNDNKRLISAFVLQIYKMKNLSVGVGNRIHKRRQMAIKQFFALNSFYFRLRRQRSVQALFSLNGFSDWVMPVTGTSVVWCSMQYLINLFEQKETFRFMLINVS